MKWYNLTDTPPEIFNDRFIVHITRVEYSFGGVLKNNRLRKSSHIFRIKYLPSIVALQSPFSALNPGTLTW